jgi:hypothetical protein
MLGFSTLSLSQTQALVLYMTQTQVLTVLHNHYVKHLSINET